MLCRGGGKTHEQCRSSCEQEGLQATVETMRARAMEPRLVEAGLVALSHVVEKAFSGNVTQGRAAVGAAGGMELALDALRTHVADARVAEQARPGSFLLYS